MIDWGRHKSAAYAAVTFFDEAGKSVGFKRLDRPTQTKTVADSSQSSCSEGEKWTHIDAFGDPCRILIEEKDNLGYVVILRQSGHYATPAASSLKPIKPTIDESQAWVKMQSLIPKHGVTAAYQMTIQQYEII